jgi:hypothetical protein
LIYQFSEVPGVEEARLGVAAMSEIAVVQKPKLHVVSCSGGKRLKRARLDDDRARDAIDIVPQLRHRHGVPGDVRASRQAGAEIKSRIGIGITRLRADHSFEYYFLEARSSAAGTRSSRRSSAKNHTGYGWAGPKMRWCTTRLKTDIINRYLTELRKKHDVIQYVGIAADEPKRIRDLNYPWWIGV